jgi:hypothetical protein
VNGATPRGTHRQQSEVNLRPSTRINSKLNVNLSIDVKQETEMKCHSWTLWSKWKQNLIINILRLHLPTKIYEWKINQKIYCSRDKKTTNRKIEDKEFSARHWWLMHL